MVRHELRSEDAEQAVLGRLMHRPEAWDEVASILSPADFSHRNGLLFAAIGKLIGAGRDADALTVMEQMRVDQTLDQDDVPVIAAMYTDAIAFENIASYAAIVADYSKRRQIIALCSEFAQQARTDRAEPTLAALSLSLERIQHRGAAKSMTMAQAIDVADAAIRAAAERRVSGIEPGVPFGLPWLDTRTGGMAPGRVYVLAARPSIGKSALLNQAAIHATGRAHAGLICSLEMTAEELANRAMANASGANVTRLTLGYRDAHDTAAEAAVGLGALPLWIDTDTYTLSGIVAQIIAHKRQHGIQWAAVDHIGLIEADGFNNRNDQLGAISRTFKKLAKKLAIPIILVSQLNRNVEKERRRPVLADLRDSGNIEQDADVVIFLHTEADDGLDETPIEIGLAKNRGGRRGWSGPDRFVFVGAAQQFREIPRTNVAPIEPRNYGPGNRYADRAAGVSS